MFKAVGSVLELENSRYRKFKSRPGVSFVGSKLIVMTLEDALPRAMGMNHEVMRVFQNNGIADDLEKAVSSYRDSEYRAAYGSVVHTFTSPPAPHKLGWPGYMNFVQPALEGQLRRRAEDRGAAGLPRR
jgi:2-polyprenyl-6-methoxyphenol hydroxylase-like FAD-dependent oxidoreductase